MKVLRSTFFSKQSDGKIIKYTSLKDKTLLAISYILISIGIFAAISSTYNTAQVYGLSDTYFVVKHLFACLLAIVCINFFSRYAGLLHKYIFAIWLLSVVLLFITLLQPPIKGANRWIHFLGLSIQPTEFVKIAVIIQGGKFLEKNWLKFFLTFFVPIILLLAQPDIGSCVLIITIMCAQLIIVKFHPLYILGSIVSFFCFLSITYYTLPHARLRIDMFLNPNNDIYGHGFQIYISYLSMKNGGWFGLGFGKSVIKNVLPDAHTDFVFSVLVEEFGIVGGLCVIFLYIFLALRVLALQPRNERYMILQYTTIIVILAQAWLNIATTLSLCPTKGLPLPLISYGGSSLAAQGILFGMIINYSEKKSKFVFRKRDDPQ